MEILFLPAEVIYRGNSGKTLLEMAAETDILINGSCGGVGTCGKCKVQILTGRMMELDDVEKQSLTEDEIAKGYRLACRFRPSSDTVVQVPVFKDAGERKSSMSNLLKPIRPQHKTHRQVITISGPSLEDQRSSAKRIMDECTGEKMIMDKGVYASLPALIKENSIFTVTTRDNLIIHVESGDTPDRCYGISFDIGTTTVVGMLWDISKGRLLATRTATNPQGIHGADVISRITYAGESKSNLKELQDKITACLNHMIIDLAEEVGVNKENIYEITIAGNTTMVHLYMGIDPSPLAVAPFVPVFCAGVHENARDHNLAVSPWARVYILPCIAGHIGADITADLVASELLHKEGLQLMIDIGTNGEIVLSGDTDALACSTAAGPAFEGASIFQGMRAAAGAVEAVNITEGKVEVRTIGNIPPVGLCGSGIIDAVAEMLKNGLIDATGKLLDVEKLVENDVPDSLAGRVRKGRSGREFVLVFCDGSEDIVITQKDIREVQMAKAAISAGVKIMMDRMHAAPEDISKLLIAGTFGSHIHAESAVTIGLIPDIERNKIQYIGNAAGAGAAMTLLSDSKKAQAEKIPEIIKHLELSVCSDFQDVYLKEMMF